MSNITVSGQILLPSNPSSLPTPSFLNVSLSDTSRMDAAAITLASSSTEISSLYNTEGAACLRYDLTGKLSDELGFMPNAYSVSATINVGWTPGQNDEWIRKGDYLNDTTHFVDVEEGINKYKVDVEVIHYT